MSVSRERDPCTAREGRSHSLLVFLAAFVWIATAASAQNCTVSTSANVYFLPGIVGGSFGLYFDVSPNTCSWSATSNAAWLTFTSSSSGVGPGAVGYLAAANNSSLHRTGTITVQSGASSVAVSIYQNSSLCSFQMAPSSLSFPAQGGTGSISVAASANDCDWFPLAGALWITGLPTGGIIGTGQFTFTVAANPGPSARSNTLTLYGGTGPSPTVTVNQAAPGQDCTFTLSQNGDLLTGAGANAHFSFNAAPSTCNWTASSNVTWVSISPSSGVGSGTINFIVAPNNSSVHRTGGIVLQSGSSSITFPIDQNSTLCSFQMTLTSLSFPPQGGTSSISVTASASDCAWFPYDATWTGTGGTQRSVFWITGLPTQAINGTGQFSLTAASNSTSFQRTDTFSLYGGTSPSPTVTVSQDGIVQTPPVLSINPTSLSFTYQQGGIQAASQSVSITSSSGSLNYTTTVSGSTWLSVAPMTGSTPATLVVSTNGTSLSPGTWTGSITVNAAGAANGPQTINVSLQVLRASLAISTSSLPNGTAATSYSVDLSASGGAPPYNWTIPAGSLPPGIAMDPLGHIRGTPVASGTFNFTVRVTDSAGATVTKDFSITVSSSAPAVILISLGQTVSGNLTAASAPSVVCVVCYADVYEFTLTSPPPPGADVAILLESSDFDAYLRLLDSSGQELAADDDSGFNRNALIRYFTGPGTYRIEASSRTPGVGGAYRLTLRLSQPFFGNIAVGQTQTGNLTLWSGLSSHCKACFGDLWDFVVGSSQTVTVNMTSTDFDPHMKVWHWDGFQFTLVAEDDNGGGGTTARVTLQSGTYRMEATSSQPGLGAYTLSLPVCIDTW
jgi:hypothetical protein